MIRGRFARWRALLLILPRLGLHNLMRVAVYRLLIATRLHPVCRVRAAPVIGAFFLRPTAACSGRASLRWHDTLRYFDCIESPLMADTPDWFFRPASGHSAEPSDRPWWLSGDFDTQLGDIKDIWDISRFSWVLALAQRSACGDTVSLDRLNLWIADWLKHNPPYVGYNWKCGQEASIRVMHLAIAAYLLDQTASATPALRALVRTHLARISPTVGYAIAQDNNHGICEAAALFIGGAWLAQIEDDATARAWMLRGRKQLEERATRLIADDGSFSMYSVMYHREFLDAMGMAEIWRRAFNLADFSAKYHMKVARAVSWLVACVHPGSGDAPNIGANDGTRLLPLTDTDYRDFRPSVQLASVLFHGVAAYPDGDWNDVLHWLKIPLPQGEMSMRVSHLSDSGGLAQLVSPNEDVQVFVRFPYYTFRPSHADPLHIDLWIDGDNVLRGPGSYRYHTEAEWQDYFPSVAAHNTVQFDDMEAMPRLGRFLFGDWLRLDSRPLLEKSLNGQSFQASYQHPSGARHERRVELQTGRLTVCDNLVGFRRKAVVRWRLHPGEWRLDPQGVSLDHFRLAVSAANDVQIRLLQGWEARCYGTRTPLPVLEIESSHPGRVTTSLEWRVGLES